MKNKIIIFLLLILTVNNSFAQKDDLKYPNNCSRLIMQVAKEWRLDFDGKKNIRKKYVQKFINSKIDNVTSSNVLNNLGSPCEIWEESDKTSYVYYFFYGKRYNSKFYAEYLIFTFDKENSFLLSISKDESDRSQ